MSKTKLHEVLAVESDREQAANAILAETLTTFTKRTEHFIGKHTKYVPFDENSPDADETARDIVTTVKDKLSHCLSVAGRALDVTATKDMTNTKACASIEIDGKAITGPLPATTLLMLENRLKKWIEIFLAIPTLAPGRSWQLTPEKGAGVYLDPLPEAKFRTKKETMHKVLYEATKEHPAQIDKWAEDVRIGRITETTWCSMYSPAEKSELLERAQTLLVATKQARQRANAQECEQVDLADALIKFLLK